jgi:hypothetical protein
VKPSESKLKKLAANRNSTARLKLRLKTVRTALKEPLRRTKPRATPKGRCSETKPLTGPRRHKLPLKAERIKLKQSAARSSNRRAKAKTKRPKNHNQYQPLRTRLPRLLNEFSGRGQTYTSESNLFAFRR